MDVAIGVAFGLVAAAPVVAAFVLCGAAWIQDRQWWDFLPPALALVVLGVVVVAEGLAGEGVVWWLIPAGVVIVVVAFFAPWAWLKITKGHDASG